MQYQLQTRPVIPQVEVNNSTVLDTFRETTSYATNQEFPNISRNQMVHYRVHKRPLLVATLNHLNPVRTTPHPSVLNTVLHLGTGLPSGPFTSGFSTKILYVVLFSPIGATLPAHLVLLHFIIPIVLGEVAANAQTQKPTTSRVHLMQQRNTSNTPTRLNKERN
jgi:hypothetical protein